MVLNHSGLGVPRCQGSQPQVVILPNHPSRRSFKTESTRSGLGIGLSAVCVACPSRRYPAGRVVPGLRRRRIGKVEINRDVVGREKIVVGMRSSGGRYVQTGG